MKQKGDVWAAAFVVVLCIAFSALTFAESPPWWTTRGVLNTNWPANDFTPVLAGQLKWMATNAAAELETLPGGAGTGVHGLVNSFTLSNNYVPINLGQLKNTAAPFYQRLMAVGYATNYPWTEDTADDSDFAPAVLGQLKYVFDFDVSADSDDDQMPDWWENANGLDSEWNDSDEDPDLDGFSNLEEYQANPGTCPTNPLSAPPGALYVGSNSTGMADGSYTNPYQSISLGMSNAVGGMRVLIFPGVYSGATNRNLDFCGKAITVRGLTGATGTVVDCEGSGRGCQFMAGETPNSVLRGITIRNGDVGEADGGGIYITSAAPQIISCVIQDCRARNGAGIYCAESSATFVDCIIRTNIAAGMAGGVGSYGRRNAVKIEGCLIVANEAGSDGGGIRFVGGTNIVSSSTIAFNMAAWDGGGGFLNGRETISNCVVAANAANAGGGFSLVGPSKITHCLVADNIVTCGVGGGITLYDSSFLEQLPLPTGYPSVVESHIVGNRVLDGDGGGMLIDGSTCEDDFAPAISNCIVAENHVSDYGGGLSVIQASPPVVGCALLNNVSEYGGGVNVCDGARPVIRNSVIQNNRARSSGGGIAVACSSEETFGGQDSSLSLVSSMVVRNSAGESGGGLHFWVPYGTSVEGDAEPLLDGCVVAGNTAVSNGAGVHVRNVLATISVKNCSVLANKLNGDGRAAGVYFRGASTAKVDNCVLWANSGGEQLFVSNSIANIRYSCVDGGYSGSGAGLGIITNDPVLDATGYHLRGSNSPCFNAGTNNALLADIDGDARPQQGVVDMGCDEWVDSDGDGMPDWWELLYDLNVESTNDAIADGDADGLNNLNEYLQGTDAFLSDTDGDGLSDGTDLYPLDANNPPVLSIWTPAAGASYVATAEVPVVVSATSPVRAISKVEFYADGAKFSEATSSPFTTRWTCAVAGTHILSACATDSAGVSNTADAVFVEVAPAPPTNLPPEVSVTNLVPGQVFSVGQSVLMQATASDSDGTIVKAEFFAGRKKIGEVLSGSLSFVWDNVPPGEYVVAVKVTDDKGAVMTSGGMAISVVFSNSAYVVHDVGALGGSNSVANAVSSAGRIAGGGATASGWHALVWTDGDSDDLGTFGGGGSEAFGINAGGSAVGYAQDDFGFDHAFLYEGEELVRIQEVEGSPQSCALGMNDLGQVVGVAYQSKVFGGTSNSCGDTRFFFLPRPVISWGGAERRFELLADKTGVVFAINNAADAVGWFETNGAKHAFQYSDGVLSDLGTLGGVASVAYDINESGQAVGWAKTMRPRIPWTDTGAGTYQAGGSSGQGAAGGGVTRVSYAPSGTTDSTRIQAVLFNGGAKTVLGTLGGVRSEAYGINNLGQVVGMADTAWADANGAPVVHAFLWENGVMSDINSLLPAGSGWELESAWGINDYGQIVGWGRLNGARRGFLMMEDGDRDGLPDAFEQQIIDASQVDALNTIFDVHVGDDFDGDGVSNQDEFAQGSNPTLLDTDGDKVFDGLDAHPTVNIDSDDDGLPDDWEVAHNLDPTSAVGNDGASGDPDIDSITNLQEFQRGSDPQNGTFTPGALDFDDVIGLRVEVDDSANCGGTNNMAQNREVVGPVGGVTPTVCYVLSVTVEGSVERQDASYDAVYVNDVLFFNGDKENLGCAMATKTVTKVVPLCCGETNLILRYDTGDGLYHHGAYAVIKNVTVLTVLKVDLDIDVDDDGDVDDTDESKEESPGAIVFENWDNDDGDSAHTPDKGETSVTGENDLVPIYPKLEPTLTTGTLKLEATAGGSRVKVWTSATKGTEVPLPVTWNLATSTVPATLYLEGYDESTSANDVELKLSYADGGSSICDDKLKVTVVRQNLGVAIYRALDSATIIFLAGDFNHAGLITAYTGTRTKVALTNDANWGVIEMPGLFSGVAQNTLQGYKAAASPFHGFYSVNSLSDSQRNHIVTNAYLCLADGTISYSWYVAIDGDGPGLNWDGTIGDIDELRCDGLVEVCYELANVEVWGRNGAHYLIQDFAAEHNDFGMSDPQTLLSPIVQRGGVTNSPTRFVSTVLFQPQTLP